MFLYIFNSTPYAFKLSNSFSSFWQMILEPASTAIYCFAKQRERQGIEDCSAFLKTVLNGPRGYQEIDSPFPSVASGMGCWYSPARQIPPGPRLHRQSAGQPSP